MTIIQILGTGCSRCKKLMENAEKAARELDGNYEVIKVTDIKEILKFGILMTPALAVDNEVKSAGKVLSPEEIKAIIS
ncbi:MAG: thioredoxin family protein [Candidatus Aminicenantes bacterium]|nr:thioredoxin family protein [Candidatus Aminicenantes bacterium]